ncbi:MAG: RDD family protein [Thermodesulfovibrionales bacterium]|jgi:uncharacterized RDD family membrane protein YckC
MPENRGKASLLLRVIAKAVDFIIIAVVSEVIPKAGYLAGLLYLLISDGLFDGRSLGKRLLRLSVVSTATVAPGSFRESVLRNSTIAAALVLYKIPLLGWLFALAVIGLEFLLMLGNSEGLRLGDNMAETKVVEDEARRTEG